MKWVNFCAFWGPKSAPILIFGVEYLWDPHHEGPHHKAPRPTTHHKGSHPLCSWGAPRSIKGGSPVGAAPRGPGWVFLYSYPKQGPGDLVRAGRWWANLPMKALLICNFLTKTPLFALFLATANREKSIKQIIVAVFFIWQVRFLSDPGPIIVYPCHLLTD